MGDPAPGGIIERFFQTVQNQFETEVRAGDILTLEEINQALAAWMNVAYHQEVHSEIAQTPQERCQTGRLATRFVDPASVIEGFRERVGRTVNPTFSDVQLNRRWFKVDPRYRGDRVMVHFDPFHDLETVEIYSLEECYLCTAPRHQREQSEPATITPPGKPQTSYLDLLNRQHQQQIDQRVGGIDYTQALKPWPFQAFLNAWARLAGRTLADFTPHELNLLQDFHSKNTWITRDHLKTAFQKAPANTVAAILWQLEQHRKEVS